MWREGTIAHAKPKKKKALSSCHEILRQQRPPGDGWNDARKEKENATKGPTHKPMHDNVDVWASSGTVMWTSPLFMRLAVFLAECRNVGPHQLADVGPTWQVWNGLPRFQKGVSVWTSFSS